MFIWEATKRVPFEWSPSGRVQIWRFIPYGNPYLQGLLFRNKTEERRIEGKTKRRKEGQEERRKEEKKAGGKEAERERGKEGKKEKRKNGKKKKRKEGKKGEARMNTHLELKQM